MVVVTAFSHIAAVLVAAILVASIIIDNIIFTVSSNVHHQVFKRMSQNRKG